MSANKFLEFDAKANLRRGWIVQTSLLVPTLLPRCTHSCASVSRQLCPFVHGLRLLAHGVTSIVAFDAAIGPFESLLAPLLASARFEF